MRYAEHVLGIPIFVHLDALLQAMPSQPKVSSRFFGTSHSSRHNAAFILPQDAVFLTIIICSNGGLYVRTQSDDDTLYVMQGQWSVLAHVFPPDSVLFAIVYDTRAGHIQLGVYDMIRENGQDLQQEDIVARHARVQHFIQSYRQVGNTANVVAHWVGYEDACLTCFTNDKDAMPFVPRCTLRLLPDQYCRVLQVSTPS